MLDLFQAQQRIADAQYPVNQRLVVPSRPQQPPLDVRQQGGHRRDQIAFVEILNPGGKNGDAPVRGTGLPL